MKVRASTRPVAGEASFVVVTGFSGAGKSHAIRALEDLGYFCVDNLPIALLPAFADLSLDSPDTGRRAAVVIGSVLGLVAWRRLGGVIEPFLTNLTVAPSDPLLLAASGGVIAAMTLVAGLVPARRAMRAARV